MTQQKVASLTSSLFARKGKASPAGLLISELAAGEAESAAAVAPEDAAADTNGGGEARRPGANGSGLNGSAPIGSGLNGTALNGKALNGTGRRKPKPSEQLPLLAFVEAQDASAQGAADRDASEPAVELPPPASLLESRLLRRDRRGTPEADAGAPTEEAPEEVVEAEVVSGDANVAAIEDAPQDGEGDSKAESAAGPEAVEAEAADRESVEPMAAESEAAESEAAETGTAGAAEAEIAPAPVAAAASAPGMPATLALRQAAALASAGPVPVAARTETMPSPSGARGAALGSGVPWRSAAVLALGAVLGLGFYLVLAGEPAAPPPTAVPAPEAPLASAVPAPQSSPEPAAPPAEPAAPAAGALPPADAQASAPVVAEVPTAEPSFDIIRIEPDGQSIIAGRATPGSEWILLNNGSPIAAVRADANGEWVVLPDTALVPGANAFSLVPKDERGKVAIPVPGSGAPESLAPAPAAPAADESPGPRAEAAGPALALPKPKPQQAGSASLPSVSFRAIEDGAYEVQLASVRQTADAERERRRLAAAFPQLLGAMDLRVQEATLEGAGVFYRVRSGAIGELGLARELCRRLAVAGQGCLVVRRSEAVPSEVADDIPDAAAATRQQAAERPR